MACSDGQPSPIECLAGRFAAKEAVVKALGLDSCSSPVARAGASAVHRHFRVRSPSLPRLRESPMCLLPGRSGAAYKSTRLSFAWPSGHPHRRPPRWRAAPRSGSQVPQAGGSETAAELVPTDASSSAAHSAPTWPSTMTAFGRLGPHAVRSRWPCSRAHEPLLARLERVPPRPPASFASGATTRPAARCHRRVLTPISHPFHTHLLGSRVLSDLSICRVFVPRFRRFAGSLFSIVRLRTR
ncbi:MAG: hypothetical protein ABSG43_28050 [Solirubrobacteraceae bacterium]